MQITVCDVCGEKNTLSIHLEYDRVYNGTDYDTPAEKYDLCINHLYGLVKYLIKDNDYETNKETIKYLNRMRQCFR